MFSVSVAGFALLFCSILLARVPPSSIQSDALFSRRGIVWYKRAETLGMQTVVETIQFNRCSIDWRVNRLGYGRMPNAVYIRNSDHKVRARRYLDPGWENLRAEYSASGAGRAGRWGFQKLGVSAGGL